MAEEQSADRDLDPTPQRIDEFRQEGRVALSKDVMSAVQLAAAALAFASLGPAVWAGIKGATAWVMMHVGDDGGRGTTLADALVVQLDAMATPTLGLCAAVAAAAIGAGLVQTRFNWAPKAIGFKLNRFNPASRLGEIFHPKKLSVNVALSALKIFAGGAVLTLLLTSTLAGYAQLALGSLPGAELWVRDQLWTMLLATTLVLSVTAALDYLWQRFQVGQQLKMTREEMRRELEEQEGKPLYRSRRRAMHRDLTVNRIIQNVPVADVIVTNPTHFAVALRYRPGEDRAPMVTAKGADTLAAHIRTLAAQHDVPCVENRPLARTLWRKVKVGKEVPVNLYQAVAEVLAKVWRRRRGKIRVQRGQAPARRP